MSDYTMDNEHQPEEEIDLMSSAGRKFVREVEAEEVVDAVEVKPFEDKGEAKLAVEVEAEKYYQRTEILRVLGSASIPFKTVGEFLEAAERMHQYAMTGQTAPQPPAGEQEQPQEGAQQPQDGPIAPLPTLTLKDLGI